MLLKKLVVAACATLAAGVAIATAAQAQNEQFIPGLVYRTGAYAPNGIPFADGVADYVAMINARDGLRLWYSMVMTGKSVLISNSLLNLPRW